MSDDYSLQLFQAKLFLGIRRLDSIIGVATFSREFWPRKFFRIWYPIHKLFHIIALNDIDCGKIAQIVCNLQE